MKLLATTAAEVFDHAEAYFRTTARPCQLSGISRYVNGSERCVVGAMILTESDAETFWLGQYKGVSFGLLAGVFSVHPNTKLARAMWAVQKLHDNAENWVSGAGFMAWEEFFEAKKDLT